MTPSLLRTGEKVAAEVIRGPNPVWADRIEGLLRHKGDPWNWQNSELLRGETGVDARFFVLHREGAPFSHIMLVENTGVGFLGHVWTEPGDRRSGASSILIDLLLSDFRARGGRALFLGTEFDSPPWHFYRRRGFEPVEPRSGYMVLYGQPPAEFSRDWFGAQDAIVEPLDWPHWPASAPLFFGAFPGVVRLAATHLLGRRSPEESLLPLLREERRRRSAGELGCARVLRSAEERAVLGIASCYPDTFWPGGAVLDLYCHSEWWHRADELLAALPLPKTGRLVAYADSNLTSKCSALERAGFRPVAVLPQWVALDAIGSAFVDIAVFSRS